MGIAIGVAEFKSIAYGLEMLDKMTKTASVDIVQNRTICIGKFLVTISGDVADVQASINSVKEENNDLLILAEVIPSIMDGVIEKINASIDRKDVQSVGVVEARNLSVGMLCANKIKKTAQVELLKVNMNLGLGGKSVIVFTGDIASVESAIDATKDLLMSEGLERDLIATAAIASPSRDFIEKFNA